MVCGTVVACGGGGHGHSIGVGVWSFPPRHGVVVVAGGVIISIMQ